MARKVAITGIGAVTPVGLSAPASCAALRASIARLGPVASTAVDAPEGEIRPATGGRVPLEWFFGGPKLEDWPGHERFKLTLPPPLEWLVQNGPGRLIEMAVPAAHEAWGHRCVSGAPGNNWGLFLGLAEGEPDQEVSTALIASFPGWRPAAVETVCRGRAAALSALRQAEKRVSAGELEGALVGGVDSLIRPGVFEMLEAAGIAKNADTNPHGVVPGEAAAFLKLEVRAHDQRAAGLDGTALAEEPTAGTETPNQGLGLTAAIRGLRKEASSLNARPLVICDLNGDRYRALEWSYALIRALGDLPFAEGVSLANEFWHPADCIGDVGAASGALNAVWAVESLRKGYAGTPQVMIWGASDGKLRAAALVSGAN
jgi:3-oxoacyl-[acyl-carrier-protein] synthase-1